MSTFFSIFYPRLIFSGKESNFGSRCRLRAVRDFTEMETIQAQIVIATNLQARRISAAENMQREDLYAIETIEAIVEIVDAELIEDVEYPSMGRKPVDRVKAVSGRLHSTISSKNRGSQVSKKAELLLSKFTQQLEKIFKNLPKCLEWRSFYLNDLPILMDFCEEVSFTLHRRETLFSIQWRVVAKDLYIRTTN